MLEKRKEAQRRIVELEAELAASAGGREEAQAVRSRCNQLQVRPSVNSRVWPVWIVLAGAVKACNQASCGAWCAALIALSLLLSASG